jgi:iron complex outermembrane receptor protein
MRRIAIVLLTSCAVLSAPAIAQDAPAIPSREGDVEDAAPVVPGRETAYGVTDIVVTAQRRQESVQDVPIPISVVTADQLDRQQVSQLGDLARSSASLQFGSVGGSGGGGGGAFIRGIGTASLSRGAESAVGIVVDGVVQGNTNINNLFDIARVEILRGPQGTLFGQSVSAGVINISTHAPDPSSVEGKVTVELSADDFLGSEFGRQVARGGLNLPVADSAAFRVSGYGARTAGVLRNVFLDKDDHFEEAGGRARFLADIGERVTVNLIGDYNYQEGRRGQFFTYVDALVPTTAAALAACGVEARPGNLEHCSHAGELQTGESFGGSAQIDIELGSLTLTSITAHRENHLFVTGDIDRIATQFNPGVNVTSGVETDYAQFTQEIRLASDPLLPFSFTVGAFYYDADTGLLQDPELGQSVRLPNGFLIATFNDQQIESRNWSGFGEGRYDFGDFAVFAGVRLTHSDIRHQETRQGITLSGPIPNGPVLTTDYSFEDTDLSWRVGGQYEVSRDLMFYGSVARGYKNAQLSPILVLNNMPILERVIDPEKPTAYELGVKSTLLEGRLAVNVNGFYQRIKDLQGQTFVTLSDSPTPVLLPTNISKVISKGVEADIFGQIGDNLTLNASAIYNIAEYPSDYFDQAGLSLEGEQVAFAPRFSANISGEFVQPLSALVEGFLSLDVRYRSEVRLSDVRVSDALTVDEDRFIFGGRIGARVEDRWSVALFANNIGASRTPGNFNLLLGNKAAFYSSQSLRQVGLQASFEF